jgi:hydrogenase maturation protease
MARARSPKPPLFIGIGNAACGDDGVGLEIVRRVARAADARGAPVRAIEVTSDPAALIEVMRDEDSVVVFDAVASGAPSGTVHRLDASTREVTAIFFHGSTHSLGLYEAIETARARRTLPPRLVVYGVEGRRFAPGSPLSREVRRAGAAVAERVVREILLDAPLAAAAPRLVPGARDAIAAESLAAGMRR